MLRIFILLSLFTLPSYAEPENPVKWSLIQQLIKASDIEAQITAHFGPFEEFPKDKAKIKSEMEDAKLSPAEITERLNIMERYYQETQKLKGPIISNILTEVAEHYDRNFTEEELRTIINSFTNPAMKKFLETSKTYMPDISEKLTSDMKKLLKPAHAQMVSQLMQVEWKYEKKSEGPQSPQKASS
jgi:hypothetical protein